MEELPTPEMLTEARRLLDGVAHHTPLMRSRHLGELVGGEVVLKAEHLQRTGSFKVRGAYAKIATLPEDVRARGVVAASAGNHAQGVAWAASRLGLPATVVMPAYAPLSKVEATRGYGATVELTGETFEDCLGRAEKICRETGATLVHAFDDPWVIAGQATVGSEIADDAPDVDRVLVPVGGGGLIAGVALGLQDLGFRGGGRRERGLPVIGVHPAATPTTIADGAAVSQIGELTGRVISELVDEVVRVDEEAISEAIVLLAERTKQVVEGAGALGLAALLAGAVPADGRSLLVVSGGNIDPGLLMQVIRHGLTEAGRYLFCRVMLADRPGRLLRVLELLASEGVNVVSVVHHRAGMTLPVGAVEVELTLETRDRDHAAEVVRALERAGYDVRR